MIFSGNRPLPDLARHGLFGIYAPGLNPRPARCFQGYLAAGGAEVQEGRAYPSTSGEGGERAAIAKRAPGGVRYRRTPTRPFADANGHPPRFAGRDSKNAFAPVLGGGRFTQPGADGGDRVTQYRNVRWPVATGRRPPCSSFCLRLRLSIYLGFRLCRHRRGPILCRYLGTSPWHSPWRRLWLLLALDLAAETLILGVHSAFFRRFGLGSAVAKGRFLPRPRPRRFSGFGVSSRVTSLSSSIQPLPAAIWAAMISGLFRLLRWCRLGLCRKRLDVLLRRSLERGVTLAAVTGTGR